MARFCTNCGNEVDENADICVKCGKQINKIQDKPQENTDDKSSLVCPNCRSKNVNIQMINESHLVAKHHSFFWWLLIGWWWIPVKWILLFVPAIIFKIFGVGKRQKIKNTIRKTAVCQNCGKDWEIK